MNGIDLLKILHERGISIPTLVTSGWWTQEAFEKELAERGVVPEKMIVFLKKPFQFEQIVVLLEKLRQGGNNNLEFSIIVTHKRRAIKKTCHNKCSKVL